MLLALCKSNGYTIKTNLFANNMSYRLRPRKQISGMTNIVSVVIQNVISMPKIVFFTSKYCESSDFSKASRLCTPITFANDDFKTYQWDMYLVIWLFRSLLTVSLVLNWNIHGEKTERRGELPYSVYGKKSPSVCLSVRVCPARAARSVDRILPDWFGAMVLGLYCTDQDEQ